MENIQTLSTILSIISLILCIDLYRKTPKIRLYLVPAIMYLGHVCVFYISRFITSHTGIFPDYLYYFSFTNWSSALRLQAIITIMLYLIIIGRYDIHFFCRLKENRVVKKIWKTG